MPTATVEADLTATERQISAARHELARDLSAVAHAEAAHALAGSAATLLSLGEARALRDWTLDELEALVATRDALRERLGRT